jgi:hypothetical protein
MASNENDGKGLRGSEEPLDGDEMTAKILVR